MIRFIIVGCFIISVVVCQELISPCPKWFRYEPRNPNEPDRVYGVLTLFSEYELIGIWIRLIFDRPSLQLGNWFGMAKTYNHKIYEIQSTNKKLMPRVPVKIRFFVKYDVNEPPPRLVEWHLNGNVVCPRTSIGESPVYTEEYYTSPEIVTVPTPPRRPYRGHARPLHSENTIFQGSNLYPPDNDDSEDDDGFRGDFNFKGTLLPMPEEQCGIVIKAPQPLITYGQASAEGEFPWHAALYRSKEIDLTYICGASLITLNHVITVAHCVTRRTSTMAVSPSSLVVVLGKYYLKQWASAGVQEKQLDKIIVHQQYNRNTFSNDIAILKLSEPAEITIYVRPVCLWAEDTNLDSVIGRNGVVVGWGFDESGKVTEQLTKANMPVVDQETCIYSFPEFYSRFTSPHTLCAGFSNGTSVCNGDSGGGMVFPKKDTASGNTIWQIRAMVSISVALQNQLKCDTSHYVVFTDVAKYLDWITNALKL